MTSTTSKLNDLIAINLDASKGYREAFNCVNDRDLKKVFDDYSLKREKNAINLKKQLLLKGKEPVASGRIKATLHRAWMDFKSDLIGNEEKAILEECIRGEEQALAKYEEVLQSVTLDVALRKLIIQQEQDNKTALKQMKEWRSIFAKDRI